MCNNNSCGGCGICNWFSGNNWWWIIILLLLFCNCGGSTWGGCGNGCGNNWNSCDNNCNCC